MRGLVQLELLRKLEEETGRKVTDLFDWIVGTFIWRNDCFILSLW